jgi:hypothetical protein
LGASHQCLAGFALNENEGERNLKKGIASHATGNTLLTPWVTAHIMSNQAGDLGDLRKTRLDLPMTALEQPKA